MRTFISIASFLIITFVSFAVIAFVLAFLLSGAIGSIEILILLPISICIGWWGQRKFLAKLDAKAEE